MKTLFSELYNKILELFKTEKSENTGDFAANRLQVILMHDRTKLDPLIMSKMREELIDVFSKYVVIDKEKLEIDLKNEGDAAALMLNIPIIRAKTEEELEELRKKLQEEEEKVSDDVIAEDDIIEASEEDVIIEVNDETEETITSQEQEIKEESTETKVDDKPIMQ